MVTGVGSRSKSQVASLFPGMHEREAYSASMTVTVYNASFTDATGKQFHGAISWDKYTPRWLNATICPHISASEVDYPIWTARASNDRKGLTSLVQKTQGKAKRLALTLVSDGETAFANSIGK